MISMRTSAQALLALALTGAGTLSQAQDPGFYFGANFGRSKAKFDEVKLSSDIFGSTITDSSFTFRDRASGYKVYTGYQVNSYFAMELGYADLGKFDFRADTVPPGTFSGTVTTRSLAFDLVGMLPFTPEFFGFARAGWNYGETKDTYAGTGAVTVKDGSIRTRDTNYKFGLGLEYDFTRNLGLRGEAERYKFNDAAGNKGEVDFISLGLIVRFGGSRDTAPVQTASYLPAPPPVAPVPEAPRVVVVPVKAASQQYCTILDLQFEVDRDEIQRDALDRLAVIGTYMTKYPDTTAVIEGHTDNVGSDDHNLALSQNRADSVVKYLVETVHIDRSRLRAIGYGSSRPLASNDTEQGKRTNRRIGAVIACVSDVEGLKVMPARMTMALAIEFDQNSSAVKPEFKDSLKGVAKFLNEHPEVTATVEGHTGNLQATRELAMDISRQRAENVVSYLVDELGVARPRLSSEGFGRTRRFAYNTSLEGQQENRRVNIIVNYPKVP